MAEVDDDAELDEDRHGEEEADQQPHVDRLLTELHYKFSFCALGRF